MQLAAPSLPLKAAVSSSAASAGDSLSSLQAGKTSGKKKSSFADLMPDPKSSAPKDDKETTSTDDHANAEAAVIFSGWLQTTTPADAQPVTVNPNGTAKAETGDATDAAFCAAASSINAVSSDESGTSSTSGTSGASITAGASNTLGANSVSSPVVASLGVNNDATAGQTTKVSAAFAARYAAVTAKVSATNSANSAIEGDPAPVSPAVSSKDPSASPTVAVNDPALVANLTTSTEAAIAAAPNPTTSPVSFVAKPTSGKALSALKVDGEKNALPLGEAAQGIKTDSVASDKNFLTTDEQEVEEDMPTVGIDAAKSAANMPATFSHRSLSSANDRSMLTAFSTDASTATAETSATSAASDAHRAVDAVLSASERLTTSGQGVNLQFSLGGADLAVRVEMRAGELHATFRTNSPELRAALSNEWHAAAAQDAASPLRMVEPVFASSNSTNTGDYSQSASSQQRDSNSNSNSRETSSGSPSFTRSSSGESSDDSSSQKEPRQPRSFFGANQHLHAFA